MTPATWDISTGTATCSWPDRSDDVINRGGEKIYPIQIEDVLLAQPGVRSAAVVAAHDEVLGESPVAYVVPAESWRPELAEELREACAAALPRAKRPSEFRLVSALPLGPTGKIARHRLRELAAGRRPAGLPRCRGWRARSGSGG